ncbi:hypothetical protein V6767_13765, partial [Martelella sp. FLE1502]
MTVDHQAIKALHTELQGDFVRVAGVLVSAFQSRFINCRCDDGKFGLINNLVLNRSGFAGGLVSIVTRLGL